MIPASELRIGNRVFLYDNVDVIVTEIMASGITYDRIDGTEIVGHEEWQYVYPIPLTHEILQKCEFERHGGLYRHKKEYHLVVHEDGGGRWGICSYSGMVINPGKRYLHQLQNLYLALTGEELEYKPLPEKTT